MSDPLDLFFETKEEEPEDVKPVGIVGKGNQTRGYMDAIKGRLTEEQISDGYEEKYGRPPARFAEINVMGTHYTGKKIEITGGDIFVDGEKKGTMPNTSGAWIKVISGKHITGGAYTVIQ
jgi:hypothetical protein